MLRHHRTCPNFAKKCTALLELAIIMEYFDFWSLEIFQKILLLVEHLKSDIRLVLCQHTTRRSETTWPY